ncbi:MAG: sodium-dependent transporter [bacterium]|nr:sodium-dependent transporter [bacterium]
MSTNVASRGKWSSKFGFVLAAAGSAIGLGNIWRFPYTVGENGGGAFVLVYLLFVALIGVPVLLAELSMGRSTERSAVGAFKKLMPDSWWPAVGGLGVLCGFGILSFYSVIAGLTLSYLYMAAQGKFTGGFTGAESEQVFGALTSNPLATVGLTAAFLVLTALVVRGGISGGIERAAKILMPIFLVILLILVGRAVTLPGADEGLRFLFAFDFSKLGAAGIMSALGQALFSMSLGMGAMITYGSYLRKEDNLPSAGLTVAFFDTGLALVAGLMIFPAVFAAGLEPEAGPKLIFIVMATIFDTLPFGLFFAVAFYGLLAIAALTSTISLLEVIVAYFVDERSWTREKAVWMMTAACFALAVPSALSLNPSSSLADMVDTNDFLDLANIVFGNYFLSIGAVFICLFVGWKWGVANAVAEMRQGGAKLFAAPLWGVLVRYVCPVAVIIVLIYAAATNSYL